MNGAPDWQDGECCFRCRTQFTLMARKHHCRNCGNIFCAKCSSQQIPLPKLNIEKNVRVCDTCYEKIVGKSDDPLTLALGSKDSEQTKPKDTNSISKSSSSSSNSKSAASASAPSEQELKEEEEFQLALALSLSEAPTKVSFPEIRSYEEPRSPASKSQTTTTIPTSSNNVALSHSPATNGYSTQRSTSSQPEVVKSMSVDYPAINQPQQLPPQMVDIPPQAIDYHHIPERDREVFRFVGDVQSTLEVFTNRLESCKLRNRPVANDAAVQSSFIRLNSEVQPKLAGYIKTYDDERADYERLQDKLSQIADARAALDALREEHQEKMREQAAEAERLRQTQLATKLEAMRQKKSEMMQYQRDLALQRIKEQEVLSRQQPYQPVTPGYQEVPPLGGHHNTFDNSSVANHVHQDWQQLQQQQQQQTQMPAEQYHSQVGCYVPNYQQHFPPSTTHATHIPQQQYVAPPSTQPSVSASVQSIPQNPPSIDRASIAHLERQFLPPPAKPDEDTPLISFDD